MSFVHLIACTMTSVVNCVWFEGYNYRNTVKIVPEYRFKQIRIRDQIALFYPQGVYRILLFYGKM